MTEFFALTKISLLKLLQASAHIGRSKRKAATGLGSLLLLGGVCAYIAITYAFMLGSSMAPHGGLDVMLMMMVAMSLCFPLIFNIFSAQSLVFSTKDSDFVLSLPMSAFAVLLARLSALYVEIMLMVQLMLLPTGAVYWYLGGTGGPFVLLALFLLGFLLALIPTTLCLLLGGLVSFIVSRLPAKNLFTTLFSLVLTGVMLLGVFQLNSGFETTAANVQSLRASLGGSMPPLAWICKAVIRGDIISWLALGALCILPFMLVGWLFSLRYKQILTGLGSHNSRRSYTLRITNSSSAFGALLRKEAAKFLGTPIFLLNSGFSILLLVGASVAAVLKKDVVRQFFIDGLPLEGFVITEAMLSLALLLTLGFFLSTIYTAAVSISLEGKTLWIIKEAPLPTMQIFMAKAGFNILLVGGTALLCVPLLGYALGLGLATTLCLLALALLFGVLHSLTGLFINLWLPRMDAANDNIVVKQSASVIVSMLVGWLYLALLGGVYAFVGRWGFMVYSAVAAALLAALCAGVYLLLRSRGRRMFAQL